MIGKILFGFCLLGAVWTVKLPFDITPCDANDPEIAKCILEEGRKIGAQFTKGIPELGVEPLDPLSAGDVETNTAGLRLVINNLTVKGISKMELKGLKIDEKALTGSIELFGNLTCISDYSMNGNILILPVNSKGKSTIKLYNLNVKISFKLKLSKHEDGLQYFRAHDVKSNYTVQNGKFHLTGLLKGDKAFSNTLNQLMNDNFHELMKDFGGPNINAVVTKTIKIINHFFSKVSYSELFTGTQSVILNF